MDWVGDVGGEEIEQVADVDIRHVAHRHDIGEADAARHRPVEDAGDQRAGLRQKGELARLRPIEPEIGMEPDPRHGDAEAVRPDDAQAIRLRLIEHRLLQRGAESRRDDDNRAGAFLAEVSDQGRHGVGLGGDHRKLRRRGQRGDIAIAAPAADQLMMRIDEIDLAGETAGKHILGEHIADRAGFRARADDGDRARGENMLEITNGHRCSARTG